MTTTLIPSVEAPTINIDDPIDPYEPYYLGEPQIIYPVKLGIVFPIVFETVNGEVREGGGTVTIEPSNTECTYPNFCVDTYRPGTVVKLTAFPNENSFFLGWETISSNRGSTITRSSPLCSTETCELTINENMTIVARFVPIVNSDLAVSLEVAPQNLTLVTAPEGNLVLDEPVTLKASIKNEGTEPNISGIGSSLSLTNIQREENGPSNVTTYHWSTSSERYGGFLKLEPGQEHTLVPLSIAAVPREGKYIASIKLYNFAEHTMENNTAKMAVYVNAAEPTAVVKGDILSLGKDKKNKKATLVLSGAENREYVLPANAAEYSFQNLKLGKYTLTLQSQHYQPVEHSFEIIKGGQVKEIPIGLKRTVDSANIAPEAAAMISPEQGNTSQTFTLSGSESKDPDGDPLRYEWDFNDDFTYKEGVIIEHKFGGGEHVVTLTVVDPLGASSSVEIPIVVEAPSRVEPIELIEPRIIKSETQEL